MMLDVGDAYADEVVGFAEHASQFHDFRRCGHPSLEILEGWQVLGHEVRVREHLKALAHGAGIDLRCVVSDDAFFFEPTHSAQAGRRSQPNPVAPFLNRQPTLRPEMSDHCSICVIQIPSRSLVSFRWHRHAGIFPLNVSILSV